MSDVPVDAFAAVGTRPPSPPRSARQHAQDSRRGKANQSEAAQASRPEAAKTRPRRASTRPLTTPEVTGMLSQLIREAYDRVSVDSDLRESDRKHAAITMAVLTDKWTVVTGRPTQVIRVEEGEHARPGVMRLAERIALQQAGKSA